MSLISIVKSVPARDGAGVNINRMAGEQLHHLLDPFLMIDEIRSDNQADYMAGFPAHPHRGFETITYLISGRMTHRDHLGNEKTMSDGGVQWMTTGRGILHSEMPEPTDKSFHGFQIWLNLPSELKMTDPEYHDLGHEQIVHASLDVGSIRVITGGVNVNGDHYEAPAVNESRTRPVIADLHLLPHEQVTLDPERGQTFVYVYEGRVYEKSVTEKAEQKLSPSELGVFSPGGVRLTAGDKGLRALILGGDPLKEPVFQYGPFVMNTQDQIEQAVRDYQSGQLTA